MSAKIIYDSENVRVIARAGSSDFGLITFSPATQFANGLKFWADAIAEKSDIASIGIIAHAANWFPAEDMRRAADRINEHLGHFKNIITYGSSMGGYGAVKYSRLLRASHVLSFAPQVSIDPADVGPWDIRFKRQFKPELHTAMALQPDDVGGVVYLFHDPFFSVDRRNAAMTAACCANLRMIRSYLTGHFPVEVFKGTANITALFRHAINDDAAMIERLNNQYRRSGTSPLRARAVAELFMDRDMNVAERVVQKHPAAFDAHHLSAFYHIGAGALIRANQLDRAADFQDRAIAAFQGQPDFYTRRSAIETQRGNPRSALEWAQQAAARWPSTASSLLVAECLNKLERLVESSKVLEQILETDPNCLLAVQRLAAAAKALQDQAGHLKWAERLVRLSPSATNYLSLAEHHVAAENYFAAQVVLREAVKSAPANTTLRQKLAEVSGKASQWRRGGGASFPPRGDSCFAHALGAGSWLRDSDDAIIHPHDILRGQNGEVMVAGHRISEDQLKPAAAGLGLPQQLYYSYDGWKLERLVLFSPLIYYCAFGAAEVFQCLQISIDSLFSYGRYAGDVLIISDRHEDDVKGMFSPHIADHIQVHQITGAENNFAYTMARYIMDPALLSGYGPILYLDTDIVANNDITPLLNTVARSGSVSLSVEKRHPDPYEYSFMEFADVPMGFGKYFGKWLIELDGCSTDAKRLAFYSSGTIGFSDGRTALEVCALVRGAIEQFQRARPDDDRVQWLLDQPFLNYVVYKGFRERVGNLDSYVEFNARREISTLGSRLGLIHFQGGVGLAVPKMKLMAAYIAALERSVS